MPIFSAVGTIFSAFSGAGAASDAGAAQAAAYNYNAAVARNNAIAAQQAAEANAKQQQRLNDARLGKLTAGILHQGVLLEGTPLLMIQDEAAQNELEKQKILYRGQIQANQYNNQATLDSYNAQVAQSAGESRSNSIMTNGIFSGLGSVGSALFRN